MRLMRKTPRFVRFVQSTGILASFLLCLPGGRCSGQQTGRAPLDPQVQRPLSDRKTALAVATAHLTLADAEGAWNNGDKAHGEDLARQARRQLLPALVDPRQDDVEVWRLLGGIANATSNVCDAAFAFEAIQRLRPDYSRDGRLMSLMAQLNQMPIQDKVKAIPDERETVVWFMEEVKKVPSAVIAWTGLAECYDFGDGVPQNYPEAVTWYRKAAEKGDAEAMYNLGGLYNRGQGVPQDYQQAAQWYRQAAEKGDGDAMYNLGVFYSNGQGVARDYQQATQWYRQAAEKGDAGAMYNLGGAYFDGRGVPRDYGQAVYWYRQAAEKGHPLALSNLGACYYNGFGVAQDRKRGIRLTIEAARAGCEKAQENLTIWHVSWRRTKSVWKRLGL